MCEDNRRGEQKKKKAYGSTQEHSRDTLLSKNKLAAVVDEHTGIVYLVHECRRHLFIPGTWYAIIRARNLDMIQLLGNINNWLLVRGSVLHVPVIVYGDTQLLKNKQRLNVCGFEEETPHVAPEPVNIGRQINSRGGGHWHRQSLD